MSPSPLLLFLFFFLLLASSSLSSTGSDLLSELQALRSRSPSGVIRLTDALVDRFLTSVPSPRPYTLVVFFDAAHLRDKPDLHLPRLRSEFSILSSSFSQNNPESSSNNLFFCDVEFSDSQRSFSVFSVASLPHVRLVLPSSSPSSSLPMDQSAFSRLADSMAEFIESNSPFNVGSIRRPPPISPAQVAIILLIIVVAAPFTIMSIIRGESLFNDARFWMASAVFVYFFSVSGAMHNVIRKMPMFMFDRNDPSKIVFFYQGSGMQLGAEGFAVGSLYTLVGLVLAFITHVLVRARNVGTQRVVMLVAMAVSVWAVRKVVYLDNWKTGYRVHAYWPSRWR